MKLLNLFMDKGKNLKEVYKPADQAQPNVKEAKILYHHIHFNVAGVTFKTGNKSRQAISRKIKFKDAPFETINSFEIEPFQYEGGNAYKVLVNGEQIGNIPREIISEFEQYKNRRMDITQLDIKGGGVEYSYGCEITLKFYLQELRVMYDDSSET